MSASGLAAHLSPAELGQRYRAARSPIERSHLQIVWLLCRGRSEREVARVTGYGRRWVGEVARRYEEGEPDGLGDRRRGNAGARPLLGAEDEAALRALLTTDALVEPAAGAPGALDVGYAAVLERWPAGVTPLPRRPADVMAFDTSDSTYVVGTRRFSW